MTLESQLATFIRTQRADELSDDAARIARRVLLAAVGTGIAGAAEDGIGPLRQLLLERGGSAQARTLVFGDRLPAHAAAQLNGTMCRALDYCDAMAPGIHIGSSVVPAAFAAAELAGGCSGAELLAALAVGCEVGARFNLTESMYDGFDPTGVAIVFASTAAAARLLRLDETQTVHALGLAFNRCGGSFQSNIDGTLAVRVIQGWVAQTGIECAQMALHGIGGPINFLSGVYGYPHLYGRGRLDPGGMVARLGEEWRLDRMVFKKYPSCGVTQALTELTLELVDALDLTPERVRRVEVRLPPYAHKLVGHPFRIGTNPRVDAQFSARYCVANAIARRASKLAHFRPEQVVDPEVNALVDKVSVVSDPALDARGHTAVDVTLTRSDGHRQTRRLDIAPGFPGNGLSRAQQIARFADCMAYAQPALPQRQVDAFLNGVEALESRDDARVLIDLLIVPQRRPPG
jgi:2-methylcitrate dehydratase PrpD